MQRVNGPGVQLHFNGVSHWFASLKNLDGKIYVMLMLMIVLEPINL